MQSVTVLSAIIIALCCIDFASTSGSSFECDCTCNLPSGRSAGRRSDTNTVSLEVGPCDNNKCLEICKLTYPLCESARGEMQSTCRDVEPAPTTEATTTTPPTTTTSPTTPTTTSVTPTPSSGTEITSTTTLVTPTPSSGTEVTSTTAKSTPPPPWSTTSTTPAGSVTTGATTVSGANTIKSVFQVSHFILFSLVLTVFYL